MADVEITIYQKDGSHEVDTAKQLTTIQKMPLRGIVDSHTHVMSLNCTPLPLFWSTAVQDQLPGWLRSSVRWLSDQPPLDRVMRSRQPVAALGIFTTIIEGARMAVRSIPKVGWLCPIPPIPGGVSGTLQAQSTYAIGETLMGVNQHAFGFWNYSPDKVTRQGGYRGKELFTPVIVLAMDMEYAHIDGFAGHKIYRNQTRDVRGPMDQLVQGLPYLYDGKKSLAGLKNPFRCIPGKLEPGDGSLSVPLFSIGLPDPNSRKPYYYHDRDSQKDVTLPQDESWLYTTYEQQLSETIKLAARYPFRLLPMFHYEPRRWMSPLDPAPDLWRYPFKFIPSTSKEPNPAASELFIGFKTYTPLGYRPLDPRLAHQEKFYRDCEANGIPIINHCSTGGAYTHDRRHYLKYDMESLPGFHRQHRPAQILDYFYLKDKNWKVCKHREDCFKNQKCEFAHCKAGTYLPLAWLSKLQKCPNKKLCRANQSPEAHTFELHYPDCVFGDCFFRAGVDEQKDHYFRHAYVSPHAWTKVLEK